MSRDIELVCTGKNDPLLRGRMASHYSCPGGFVGRSICYAIRFNHVYYGHIVAGSATLHLPGRNEFFGIKKSDLNRVANNVFFNVSPPSDDAKYPLRNFTTAVVKKFMSQIRNDWPAKYGDELVGLETLVEPPRTGELYRRAGWTEVGVTHGFTCKRLPGKGSDSWGGRRVWTKDILHPKVVLCYKFNFSGGS